MITTSDIRLMNWTIRAVVLAFVVSMPTAQAMDAIAKVIVSVGKVEAYNAAGETRQLKRRSPVFVSDTVVTANGAKAQLRFTDGSMLALNPDSRFAIEEYQYQLGEEDGKAVYNLLKGGMQTITGAIGRKNKDNYELKTPTATIGIRGTYYQLKTCAGNCKGVPNGLYGGVKEGAIKITNKAGSTTIKAGQYFYLPTPDSKPMILDKPPAVLGAAEGSGEGEEKEKGEDKNKEKGEDQKQGEGSSEEKGEGSGNAPKKDSTDSQKPLLPPADGETKNPTIPPTPTGYDPQTGGGAIEDNGSSLTSSGIVLDPVGTPVTTGGFGLAFLHDRDGFVEAGTDLFKIDSNHRAYVNASGTPIFAEVEGIEDCTLCQFSSGSAALVDVGGNGPSNWGRWKGEVILLENGVPLSIVGNNFHFIQSNFVTPYSVLQGLSRQATFYWNGGPSATDVNGAQYSVYGEIDVDFGAGLITYVGLHFEDSGGATYVDVENISNAAITSSVVKDIPLEATMYSPRAATGQADLQFSGANAEYIDATFEVKTNNNTVTGVAHFDEFGGG